MKAMHSSGSGVVAEHRQARAVLDAASRFGKFKPEEEARIREAEVKTDPVQERLKEAWRKWKPDKTGFYTYEGALSVVSGIGCSSEDVEKFSLALAAYHADQDFSVLAGRFLQALIEDGKDAEYLIHTTHLCVRIECFGEKNTKSIIVDGNVGSGVGNEMSTGRIVIRGDAGDSSGVQMKGGTIEVKGNAGNSVGHSMEKGRIVVEGDAGLWVGGAMRGGEVIINGDAGNDVGFSMTGGVIHLNGRFGSLAGDTLGGRIYHKAKLIFSK